MKEERYFYTPQPERGELPQEEAKHALRVLRMGIGDEIKLMDGKGAYYRAVITAATGHRCLYAINEQLLQERAWNGRIHLAMAPTKLNDRTEWFAEKATEIGFDRLSFIDCQYSERRNIKNERIDKILIAAMKQSHKAWKPELDEMMPFRKFVEEVQGVAQKFICHCYEEEDIQQGTAAQQPVSKPHLKDVLKEGDALVLIGPEGDFSVEEVRLAERLGFRSVSLGKSRLRTETAALVAVHLMHLANEVG
ncbi:MAG: 16S rRNA (uracil(1498)-N(3))-methyltransferase [Bacteroidales bacterium]|nr:16S rRNA (uracil(1498)-N(3))-methyltransferase [Candidatus Physcousia equi]